MFPNPPLPPPRAASRAGSRRPPPAPSRWPAKRSYSRRDVRCTGRASARCSSPTCTRARPRRSGRVGYPCRAAAPPPISLGLPRSCRPWRDAPGHPRRFHPRRRRPRSGAGRGVSRLARHAARVALLLVRGNHDERAGDPPPRGSRGGECTASRGTVPAVPRAERAAHRLRAVRPRASRRAGGRGRGQRAPPVLRPRTPAGAAARLRTDDRPGADPSGPGETIVAVAGSRLFTLPAADGRRRPRSATFAPRRRLPRPADAATHQNCWSKPR